MFLLNATNAALNFLGGREVLTSGSVGTYQVRFSFSSAWNGLTRVAVFRADGNQVEPVSVSVLLDDTGVCTIPWEALVNANTYLYAGVYGTKGDEIVLPTVWAKLGRIQEGVQPGGNASPATPDLTDQVLTQARESAASALDAAARAENAAARAESAAETVEKTVRSNVVDTIQAVDQEEYEAMGDGRPSNVLYLIRG